MPQLPRRPLPWPTLALAVDRRGRPVMVSPLSSPLIVVRAVVAVVVALMSWFGPIVAVVVAVVVVTVRPRCGT